MNLFERLGFNAPQASATAQPIGQDEFGRTIYRDSTGATYAMGSQPVQRTDAQRNDQALIDAGIFPPDPADPRAAVNALATSLMSGFTAPGNALRGQPVTLGDVWGTAGTAALGSQAMPAPQNSLRAFNVYHGSPHDFDKFSMDKIGTGEGAQAYGHGLYFADNEAVAKGYRDNLSLPTGTTAKDTAARILQENGGDYDAALSDAGTRFNRALSSDKLEPAEYDRWMKTQRMLLNRDPVLGRMYEVQIDAKPEDFLDWDAPLSAQPANVLAAITKKYPDAVERMGNRSGGEFYQYYLGGATAPSDAARASVDLADDAGIPGIRYLDAGSRGAGDGSRNYVVFDENLISIVRKYGWAAAAPMLAQMGMTPEQAQAQYAAQNGS